MEKSQPLVAGDLGTIAQQLATIAERLRGEAGSKVPQSTPPHREAAPTAEEAAPTEKIDSAALAEIARKTYADRRRRVAIFGEADLFGEPAWDILLDLYIALVDKKDVSVSSACIGSASPATTGLRWLGILEERGFVLRQKDPRDQRRVLVSLSEKGRTKIEEYFRKRAA